MKRIHFSASLLFLFICLNYSMAQHSLTLTGCVKDSLTLLPLENINVSIKSKALSTITNKEGRFEIQCSKNDTLYFSSVGYTSVPLFVNENLTGKHNQITLASNFYALKTVSINPPESAAEIVKKSILKLKPTQNDKKVFEGYYYEYLRESNKQVRSYTALITVLDEANKPVGHKAEETFYIKACKKSEDISKCSPELEKRNNLEILFKQNPIRYNSVPLNIKKLKKFKFITDSIVQLQNNTYYAISYSSKEMSGQLLINTENYFIASISKQLKNNLVTTTLPGGGTFEFLPTSLTANYKQTDSTITLESIHYTWATRTITEKETCDLSITCQFVLLTENRKTLLITNKNKLVDKTKDVFIQYPTFNEAELLNNLPELKFPVK